MTLALTYIYMILFVGGDYFINLNLLMLNLYFKYLARKLLKNWVSKKNLWLNFLIYTGR